jgi:hypothetical protein
MVYPIMIHDITLPIPPKVCWITRKIDIRSLTDFNYRLSFETWKEVFEENDVKIMFNSFLNIFLRLFNTSFPKSTVKPHITKKLWISSSIKTKCNIKRHLYMISRNSNDPNIKSYYKPEGRGFNSRWGHWIFFNWPNPSGRTRPWGLLSL